MKKKIVLLDCTLRDGGYYNNWDFPKNLISKYLKSMAASGVEFAEIGFRSLETKTFKGACAYSRDSFIKNLQIPRNLKIGVMINASELLNYKTKNPIKNIKLLFKNKKSKVKLVRIACHYFEIEKTLPISIWLKKRGFKVAFNIMQIADRTDKEIEHLGKICSSYPIDVLYFADSMGSLEANKIKKIVLLLKKFWRGELGIHTHDNMDMALINTQVAVDNGVTWADSTVTGMGRGPGNSKTEYLVIKYQNQINRKVNILPLLELIKNEFEPLQKKYKWGTNPFYFLAGMHGIHPTFIQGMLNDLRFSSLDILSAIEHLKSVGGKTFNKNLLDTDKKMYSGKCEGKWSPKNKIFSKEVLILGTGPGVNEHKIAIEEYIKQKKPFVIGLNTQRSIDEKLINVRAVCSAFRLLTDRKKYKSLKQPLVLPLKRLSKDINNYLSSNTLLDFGIQVIPEKFDFKENYGILPNSLVISYALAIATSGKAKKILLAGFDGYNADDPRRVEMDNLLTLYQQSKSKIPLISITPTRYKIDSVSIYALYE
jgi:4-hydroxy 2-oxovalerate aldolase